MGSNPTVADPYSEAWPVFQSVQTKAREVYKTGRLKNVSVESRGINFIEAGPVLWTGQTGGMKTMTFLSQTGILQPIFKCLKYYLRKHFDLQTKFQ